VIADASMFDVGTLGQLGAMPGWPGAEVYPPQPMLGQTRAVLAAYRARGGRYVEEVIADAGHTPFIEQAGVFRGLLFGWVEQHHG